MEYSYKNICELFNIENSAPLPEKDIDEIRQHFGEIPKALEDYYRLCGGCKDMNSAQDFLLTPGGKYFYKLKDWNYSDYCVFYVENQFVSVWAVKKSDLSLENPPVYETYDEGKTWHKTCNCISQFLIAHAYLHAAFSFEFSTEDFYQADTEQVKKIAEKFPSANANSSLYTGVRFFQPYPDTVIALLNNDENVFDLIYSSQNEKHFEETDEIICEILGYEEDIIE